jgi:hypothetical protein
MVSELMHDPSRLEAMGTAMRRLSKPGAAKRIACEIGNLAMKKVQDA